MTAKQIGVVINGQMDRHTGEWTTINTQTGRMMRGLIILIDEQAVILMY